MRPGHVIIDYNEVSYERTLYEHLMSDYVPSVRPVRKDSDAVDVYINLYIYLLEDLVWKTWLCFYGLNHRHCWMA